MADREIAIDEDALHAAVDLVGRTGAKEFTFGYLHDDVPVEDAAWWAQAQYQGTRIIVEQHRGPIAAVEALAVRLLAGGMCTHCQGLITLSDGGAIAFEGHLGDGSEMTEERARSMPQCRWRRMGDRWVRGCESTHPQRRTPGPNRAERRRAKKSKGRGVHRG